MDKKKYKALKYAVIQLIVWAAYNGMGTTQASELLNLLGEDNSLKTSDTASLDY